MSMTAALDEDAPSAELLDILDAELDTAALVERRGQRIYRSVQQLSQLIGGEYGDRVLYELIQNAHDAHPRGEPGHIAVRLVVKAEDRGELYVANGGRGFTLENVQALRNIANSTKDVGDGIGNKGVGFRSVEALTDDPRIFSRLGGGSADRFDGYCFRFASPAEIRARLASSGNGDVAAAVADAMPRYLASMPVEEQPESVRAFARRAYATVVALPLQSREAVELAKKQVNEIVRSEAPLLLFLDRVQRLEIEIEGVPGTKPFQALTREPGGFEAVVEGCDDCTLQAVALGPERKRWLLVRRGLSRDRVLDAVRRSIPQESLLKRWLDWKGAAVVSIAAPLDGVGLQQGRLYNFLPMGPESAAPLLAHLDAPFFTAIDRRRAKLDLPLNAELLNACAEACAAAALTIAQKCADVPPRLVVDLLAWTLPNLGRLQSSFRKIGSNWSEAAVWPTRGHEWASLRGVRAWPEGRFRTFTAARTSVAAKAAILSPAIDLPRLTAVQLLAQQSYLRITPSDQELAAWAEAVAGELPRNSEAAEKLWGPFYRELAQLLPTADRLRALKGRAILLDRTGAVLPAGPDVYVRRDSARRGRGDGPPLPPRDVARKLSVLSDAIPLAPETFALFERAQLCRRYDATEILAQLAGQFTDRPAPGRREAALLWALEVWKHDTAAARKSLASAGLHVPTRSGWRPAEAAAFSGSWTGLGKHLDAFLTEAKPSCMDSAAAADALLIDWEQWPEQGTPKREWARFLGDAGVVDGLVAVPAALAKGPIQGNNVKYYLAASKDLALDAVWREHNGLRDPRHPYTSYTVEGNAWRLPGQTIVGELSDDARRRFAVLVVEHLQQFGSDHLSFKVGRFDRADTRQHDEQSVWTPLQTFLSTAPWFPQTRRGQESFVRVSEAWLLTDRRNDPRFVPRAHDEIVERLDPNGQALRILADAPLRLKVWNDRRNAGARLAVLAGVCEELQQHDRAPFRKHYDQAWRDLAETGAAVPTDLIVAAETPGGFSGVAGGRPPVPVFVRSERDRELVKLLVDTGANLLASAGEAEAPPILQVLNTTGRFDARAAEAAGIRLLVDGTPFQTSPGDPLLIDVIPWLSEALVLGHEIGARDFEKSLSTGLLEERLRRVRVRRCRSIELSPEQGPCKRLQRHLHRDESRPTLVIVGELDAAQLRDSAAQLSALLNQNLRSFEPLLLRLAACLPSGEPLADHRPSADAYAFAIQCDREVVDEHLAHHQSDDTRKLVLVTPVVAYFAGAAVALEIEGKLAAEPFGRWPALLRPHLGAAADDLVSTLEETDDLALIRRRLGLVYGRFNSALRELGRQPLSSETELRRLFQVYLDDLRAGLRDRLRRHFVSVSEEPLRLAEYASNRSLDFITFDPGWIETREELDREDVRRRAEAAFQAAWGDDPGGQLPDLEPLRAANRKDVAAFAQAALPILRAVGSALPEAWSKGAAEVAAAADRAGALDFKRLGQETLIPTLVLAGLWPAGTRETLELEELGLKQEDLDLEARRLERERADEARRRNSVEFAGRTFDASLETFGCEFAGFAEALFAGADWRSRSKLRPVSLKTLEEAQGSRGPGGPSGGKGKLRPRPPESVRSAIGLAGELLAYQYLRAKHPQRFTDACWVSELRRSLFPEDGDHTLGYDFQLLTQETEWLYEVKATPGDACEFELTDNEYRTAASVSADKGRRYRILFVQHVFDLDRCRILELPNPAAESARRQFRVIGRSSVRMGFEID
jgi:hypothetical protein